MSSDSVANPRLLTAAFMLLACGCVACGQDDDAGTQASAWSIEDLAAESTPGKAPTGQGKEAPVVTELAVESCRDDFVTGPVWEMVSDKAAAGAESEWIALLTSTRFRLAENGGLDVDYKAQEDEILESFEQLGIEVIDNEQGYFFVVAAPPAKILEVIRRSCLLSGFDLSGFHCDCAPEQCAAARTCDLMTNIAVAPDDEIKAKQAAFFAATGSIEMIATCKADFIAGLQHNIITLYDSRGAQWRFSGGSRVHSWKQSMCALPSGNDAAR